jgi:hypothetical protein
MDTSIILIIVLPIVFLLVMSYIVSGPMFFKPSNLITTNSYSGLTTIRGGSSRAKMIVSFSSVILIVIAVVFLLFATGGGEGIAKLA